MPNMRRAAEASLVVTEASILPAPMEKLSAAAPPADPSLSLASFSTLSMQFIVADDDDIRTLVVEVLLSLLHDVRAMYWISGGSYQKLFVLTPDS